MARPGRRPQSPPRLLQVIRKEKITPHMLRITLGGDDLHNFPEDQNSAYIKLRLPKENQPDEYWVRTYTVRDFKPELGELDVDFVLHDIEGPASNWAKQCVAGDTIQVGGPGPKKLLDYSADWFLIAGDMSALPAISANIEGLPEDARGYALIEIINDQDQQEINCPDDFEIIWLTNPTPEKPNGKLQAAMQDIEWLEGEPSIWVAGEISTSLDIRGYLLKTKDVNRKQMYASSYWQIGQSEDGHKISKRKAAEKDS